mmetsp:Transcript_51549/g.81812  ORF Transcript_51549/g.81812 Transcript_51549/m.81812 type:complete len:243 (+) Transcript_51549:83-811(+)|eukprot:CAMPEP_0169224686 /NCGR_PEP_ID=MMETSP1016-20121227/22799_1 /TAXON_ID=342587 /ORGANISM="Karlodinium micrum, Strain CCMP2283" /LENGTH=242 /DNA_ID=CAMNT_0009303147 /DNA_START=83 /DNA_END=811 /DNA_ORIENTATION=-
MKRARDEVASAIAAERTQVAAEKARRMPGLFPAPPDEINFGEITGSIVRGGRIGAFARAEEADRFAQPRCQWWQLKGGAKAVAGADAAKGRLDLTAVAEDDSVFVLVAEVFGSTKEVVHEADTDRLQSVNKLSPPWNVVIKEVKDDKLEEILRLRRPAGVDKGSVWVVGILMRTVSSVKFSWRIEAVNEVYPSNRLSTLLPMRCKELVPEDISAAPTTKEEEELSPGEQARRMLEEAMKEMG